jgi:hypothetical protein
MSKDEPMIVEAAAGEQDPEGRLRNSAVLIDGARGVRAVYRKAHLWDREWVRLDETGVLRASSHAPEFASPWSRRCAVLWVGARGPEFRTRRAGLRRPAVRQPVTSAPHARDDLSLAADRMRRHGPSHEPAFSTGRPSRGCQGMRAPAKVLVATATC